MNFALSSLINILMLFLVALKLTTAQKIKTASPHPIKPNQAGSQHMLKASMLTEERGCFLSTTVAVTHVCVDYVQPSMALFPH